MNAVKFRIWTRIYSHLLWDKMHQVCETSLKKENSNSKSTLCDIEQISSNYLLDKYITIKS